MPLPLILGVVATVAGAAGVGTGIHGAAKMKEANDTMKEAQRRHEENIADFEKRNKRTLQTMDQLGKKELEILESFKTFSDLIKKIHNNPEFKPYDKEDVDLPKYDPEELEKVSVGAGLLLGGIGGAAAGTAGAFAAGGMTTSAVMALGTASTGTAISSLSGVAATNATLAALGGGALSAGGGGIALGTAVLSGATLGVGLLIGGVIFNITGSKLSDKADEAWRQMREAEKEINKICEYLDDLNRTAKDFKKNLKVVESYFKDHMNKLSDIINVKLKWDWNDFSLEEKKTTENLVLFVSLLYKMCKVQFVLKKENEDCNEINKGEISQTINEVKKVLMYIN